MVTRLYCYRTTRTTTTLTMTTQKWCLLSWMLICIVVTTNNVLIVTSFSLPSSSSSVSSSSSSLHGNVYKYDKYQKQQQQHQNNQIISSCTSCSSRTTTKSIKTSISSHCKIHTCTNNTPLLKSSTLLLSLSSSMTNDNDDNNNNIVESALTKTKTNQQHSIESKSSSISSISSIKSILSTMTFIIIDIVFRRIFKICNISFPSSLGACGIVLSTLLLFQKLQSQSQSQKQQQTITTTNNNNNNIVYNWLQPGSIVLSKWLPLFFVPSLIILPLSFDSIGSITEFCKILFILVSGFIISLYTTALSVVSVSSILSSKLSSQSSQSKISQTKISTTTNAGNETLSYTPVSDSLSTTSEVAGEEQQQSPSQSPHVAVSTTTVPPVKPFSDALFRRLLILSSICSVLSIGSMYNVLPTIMKESTMTVFLLLTTITSFVYGARLPKSFTKLIHPLVTCTSITWITMLLVSLISKNQLTITKLLLLYKRNNLSLFKNSIVLYKTGPGDILLFLLGPAVVSLAISMYERRTLIRTNKIEIITSILISTIVGLFGTAYAVQLISIYNPYIRLSLLSRNITSPLAIAISTILGGDVSLAVSFVVITGLLGANFGALLLDTIPLLKNNPIARGLSIGAASHGLGTAAIVNEKDAFPFAAISMALTATIATITVSIPAIRNILIQIALK